MTTFWRALIGLLTLAAIVSLAALWRGSGPVGSENLVGEYLPNFAAPLAAGSQNGDANIYTREQARALDSVAACDVRLAGVFNSCRDLKGRAILNFWNTKKPGCTAQVQELAEYSKSHPDVAVAAVAFDQPESEVRGYLEDKNWKIAVPIDRDGAVAGLYAVAGCPSTFFVKDGTVTAVRLGSLSDEVLDRGVGSGSSGGASGAVNREVNSDG